MLLNNIKCIVSSNLWNKFLHIELVHYDNTYTGIPCKTRSDPGLVIDFKNKSLQLYTFEID